MANANIWTDEQAGPTYTTGGFVITTTLSTIASFAVRLKTIGANLGQAQFDVAFNSPGAGQATIKVMQETFDRLTGIGSITGLPSGVTLRSSSGGTYDTTSHTHDMSHNHGATPASTTPAGANAATLAVALQPAVTTHTHTLDLATFSGNFVAETAHTHTWNNIYQHQHILTNTATDLTATELANGTDLSASVFDFIATDQ